MNGYIQPFTIGERLLHIQEAKRTLGTSIPWLSDNMENGLKHALGDRPNSQFLFDEKGRIQHMWSWSDADELREANRLLLDETWSRVIRPRKNASPVLESWRVHYE